MKSTIVLTADFPPIAREILAGEFDVITHPTEHDRDENAMITLLSEADGAITLLSDPITRNVLEANPNLRIVANLAVGYNNIDVDAARELGVRVTNTPGVLTEATADFTMALMLGITRRVVEADAQLRRDRRCEWDPLGFLGMSLQGRTLGIIGMGRIGIAVAQRAAAFGMSVIYTNRSDRDPGIAAKRVSLDELLEQSDVVTLHVPLSADTHHILDRRALALLRRGSYVVNTSRGAVIDEEALADALESGHLRGAALDVFEREPIVNPRLFSLPSVILAPHIASATDEARTAMARIAATEIRRYFAGLPPIHGVV
jgi:glyoxylate reductase